MSAYGPKQTSLVAPHMSALGGKADVTFCGNPLSRSLSGVKRTWAWARTDAIVMGINASRWPYVASMSHGVFCSEGEWPKTPGNKRERLQHAVTQKNDAI